MPLPVYAACNVPQDTAGLPAAFEAGLALAQYLGGPLAAEAGALQIKTPVILGGAAIGGLVGGENKDARRRADAACALLQPAAKAKGVAARASTVHGDLLDLTAAFARSARLAAFAVCQKATAGDAIQPAIVEALLFSSGRPALVVPATYQPVNLDHLLVAWDGGEQSARAAWNALPLLRKAQEVTVVTVTGEKDFGRAPLSEDFAAALREAGIAAVAATIALNHRHAAETLEDHARSIGAGALVLGAYGRSRFRELVFGGVTRELLNAGKLPLIMSN